VLSLQRVRHILLTLNAAGIVCRRQVNWAALGRIALGTFATAALMAAAKYLKAQHDMPLAEPLATVLTGAAEQVAARTGLNDVKLGVALPALSVAPSTDATVTINGTPVGSKPTPGAQSIETHTGPRVRTQRLRAGFVVWGHRAESRHALGMLGVARFFSLLPSKSAVVWTATADTTHRDVPRAAATRSSCG